MKPRTAITPRFSDWLAELREALLIVEPGSQALLSLTRKNDGLDLFAVPIPGVQAAAVSAHRLVAVADGTLVEFANIARAASESTGNKHTQQWARRLLWPINRRMTAVALADDGALWVAIEGEGLACVTRDDGLRRARNPFAGATVTNFLASSEGPDFVVTRHVHGDSVQHRLSVAALVTARDNDCDFTAPQWHRNRCWWLQQKSRSLHCASIVNGEWIVSTVVQFSAPPLAMSLTAGVAAVAVGEGEQFGLMLIDIETGRSLAHQSLPLKLAAGTQVHWLGSSDVSWRDAGLPAPLL